MPISVLMTRWTTKPAPYSIQPRSAGNSGRGGGDDPFGIPAGRRREHELLRDADNGSNNQPTCAAGGHHERDAANQAGDNANRSSPRQQYIHTSSPLSA